ncbi:hypothetical protein AMTR_s00124p00049140 [Amborella trichopoda]|uniref:Uncharacterized protein n=1 Tax=Amborella trichopoda TaxID=13333 RepID=W1NNN9_AMBTC|nr:hypothetical protein AMTR_s00124p00049140 [Amborella trichopoda]
MSASRQLPRRLGSSIGIQAAVSTFRQSSHCLGRHPGIKASGSAAVSTFMQLSRHLGSHLSILAAVLMREIMERKREKEEGKRR